METFILLVRVYPPSKDTPCEQIYWVEDNVNQDLFAFGGLCVKIIPVRVVLRVFSFFFLQI